MGYKDAMIKHMGNISRQIGHDITGKYSYIVSEDDLVNAYVQMRDELGYPLMMDSKRRRAIVYNKKGIEKKVQSVISSSLLNNIYLLDRIVAEDIAKQLDQIIGGVKGGINGRGNTTNLFVNSMVMGLMNGIDEVIKDMYELK